MNRTGGGIWLYGSRARGDAVKDSDVDILVLGSVAEDKVTSVASQFSGPINLSRYTLAEFAKMASYGSLFLHHIQREGRCLHADAATV